MRLMSRNERKSIMTFKRFLPLYFCDIFSCPDKTCQVYFFDINRIESIRLNKFVIKNAVQVRLQKVFGTPFFVSVYLQSLFYYLSLPIVPKLFFYFFRESLNNSNKHFFLFFDFPLSCHVSVISIELHQIRRKQ